MLAFFESTTVNRPFDPHAATKHMIVSAVPILFVQYENIGIVPFSGLNLSKQRLDDLFDHLAEWIIQAVTRFADHQSRSETRRTK